jgi:RNA exonuclease 1
MYICIYIYIYIYICTGHSLDSDLKAMKISHMKCVDTSVIFPHPKGM